MSLTTPFLIAGLLSQGLAPPESNQLAFSASGGSSQANASHLVMRGPSLTLFQNYGVFLSHQVLYQSQLQNSYIQTPGFIAGEILVGRKTSPWGITGSDVIEASERNGYLELGFQIQKALAKDFVGYENPYRLSFLVRTGAQTLTTKQFHSQLWAKFPFAPEASTFGGDLKYFFKLNSEETLSVAPAAGFFYALTPQSKQEYLEPKTIIHVGPEFKYKNAALSVRLPYFANFDSLKRQFWLAWKQPEIKFSLQAQF